MKQFNINVTKDFEKDLKLYMKLTKINIKVDALRHALRDAVTRLTQGGKTTNFQTWIGAGLKAGLNNNPRFSCEDDLWS